MEEDRRFWRLLDDVVAAGQLTLEPPPAATGGSEDLGPTPAVRRGRLATAHRRDHEVWVGSLPQQLVTAVICCADAPRARLETVLLLACTAEETDAILRAYRGASREALLMQRPGLARVRPGIQPPRTPRT